jgi:oxepin-CoA hydrolase / 3-oxo-5,6-dehydrosuberyl-CoA semialdehyde dehydrogenase
VSQLIKVKFDVNDAAVRVHFLRDTLVRALAPLVEQARPRWGRMTAQQMVEHLVWAFELSTGDAQVACTIPSDQHNRMKTFLYHNRPTPQDFMNPALVEGLPTLRFASLAKAKTALQQGVTLFLENSVLRPEATYAHPVFGLIGVGEWQRSHFKHSYHHLLQFDLIEME